jgi:hypothetical protein
VLGNRRPSERPRDFATRHLGAHGVTDPRSRFPRPRRYHIAASAAGPEHETELGLRRRNAALGGRGSEPMKRVGEVERIRTGYLIGPPAKPDPSRVERLVLRDFFSNSCKILSAISS